MPAISATHVIVSTFGLHMLHQTHIGGSKIRDLAAAAYSRCLLRVVEGVSSTIRQLCLSGWRFFLRLMRVDILKFPSCCYYCLSLSLTSMRSISFAVNLIALSLAQTAFSQACESFELDFQNGGSYFQNSLSNASFTALQGFQGCQNDTANNILVDPNGDQSECSMTPLLPDDTPQFVTCSQWPQNQLYSGEWSLIIISNNGDGNPLANMRDFSLSVGPQQTLTVTPTSKSNDPLRGSHH